MILFVLLLIPASNLIFNNDNGLDNILYAKGKANTSRDDRAKDHTHTNEDTQNQEQVTNKVVILTFGDIHKSQFTTAKPILDQYGFKGSFFVPCEMVGGDSHMDWNDIKTLYTEGHDIEAKSDKNLINLSPDNLDFQVIQPKKCLSEHGIDPNTVTTFAVRHGNAVLNTTVINTVAKYYNMAINGFSNLMRLDCSGYGEQNGRDLPKGDLARILVSSSHQQTDCRTFDEDGKLTSANRYSIREWNHNAKDSKFDHNSTAIFNEFVKVVNSQSKYNDNNNGMINAIPLIAYHDIDNSLDKSSTDVSLFASEMKYLYENGFKVITMKDLGYDEMSNRLYVKNMLL
jgi:peptidoglycan/xylan/chitin deacetylase (PgdA/CDA1 family)